MYDFDRIVDRTGIRGAKWELPDEGAYLKGDRAGWISLGVADMDFASCEEIAEALRRDMRAESFGYKSGETEAFLDAACAWEETRHGRRLRRERMTACSGVISGLAQAIYALTRPGEKIVIQTPVYGAFFGLASLDGRERVENLLRRTENGWEMDFEDLEQKCEGAAAFLMCSPHNPVGRVWSAEELRRVCEICERCGCFLLVDEIHHDLLLDGRKYVSPGEAAPGFAEMIVTCAAPSKTFNVAGFGAAYVYAEDKALFGKVNGLARTLYLGCGMYSLLAGETAYRCGGAWLDEVLAYIEANRDYTAGFFAERLPELPVARLEGTYLMWADCEAAGMDSAEMDARLDGQKLRLTPGRFFGAERFARINIASPRLMLADGLERFARAMKK